MKEAEDWAKRAADEGLWPGALELWLGVWTGFVLVEMEEVLRIPMEPPVDEPFSFPPMSCCASSCLLCGEIIETQSFPKVTGSTGFASQSSHAKDATRRVVRNEFDRETELLNTIEIY